LASVFVYFLYIFIPDGYMVTPNLTAVRVITNLPYAVSSFDHKWLKAIRETTDERG